jgi:exodeoxyribonuclease VII small subunit
LDDKVAESAAVVAPCRTIGYFYQPFATRPLFLVTKTKPDTPLTFEAALAELESIVAAMEAGQLTLEKSLSAYKRGAELLQFCQSQLQDAQQQVKVLEANSLQTFAGDRDAD